MDILSAFQGVTTPPSELAAQIEQMGWELSQVRFDSGSDQFIAEARLNGDTIRKTGPDERTALANLMLAAGRRNHLRSYAMWKIGMWQPDWHHRMQEIARAYAEAPLYDPKAVPAFKALADDNMHRAGVLGDQIAIEQVNDPTPYKDAQDLHQDVREKRKYKLTRAFAGHPVWTPEQVMAHRTVHDILGHSVAGSDYTWPGEVQAVAAHMPLLENIAQQALFTEAVAKPAYQNLYGTGPQKIALFPEYLQEHQEGPAYRGIHPSQSVAPVAVPEFNFTASAEATSDPNAEWESGVDPLPEAAYVRGDPLEAQAVMDNAAKIDTDWSNLTNPDGSPNRDLMKQAIVNAFRAVLLSPRKDLKWNAVHYQDIMHIPASESDPLRYWKTLEAARQNWNVERFGEEARFAHAPYAKLLQPFYSILFQQRPTDGWKAALERGERLLMEWHEQEFARIEAEDQTKRSDKMKMADDIERAASKALTKRIKLFIDQYVPAMDFEKTAKVTWADLRTAEGDDQESLFDVPAEPGTQRVDRYGAFMGTHLKAIAKIGQHTDEILDAALADVADHDGAGHHFRSKILSLNISGVGPKVCSFAWLLLQPMTSQLATVDTHIMDVLGHDYEKDMSNRDYFKFERELAAGRDAAGYGHVPLGAFQWGIWDHKRTGPGSHQDHSAMRVLDPIPHTSIDWAPKVKNLKGQDWAKQAPLWWQETQPMREATAHEWDDTYAKEFPATSIPFQTLQPREAKIAYGEGFDHWWDKENPIGYDLDGKARRLAEYAAATKKTRSQMEDWLDEHKSETKLIDTEFKRFRKKFFAKFDRINKRGANESVISSQLIPWFEHDGHRIEGAPGQNLMHHIRAVTGLPTTQIWELFDDEGSLGKN